MRKMFGILVGESRRWSDEPRGEWGGGGVMTVHTVMTTDSQRESRAKFDSEDMIG